MFSQYTFAPIIGATRLSEVFSKTLPVMFCAVASILKHLGATNVKCYSYGTAGNFEAKIAKIIAHKLGYEWKFIPLTHKSEKKYYPF